jgi:uncharacterized protein DUF4249
MRAWARVGVVVLAGAGTAACERVVALDVPSGPSRLVVEARVERVREHPSATQRIRLTTTSPYFERGAPRPARGAMVRVHDDAGTVASFAESPAEPGVYTTSALPGVVGRAYTLTIDFEGQRYEATERLVPVVPIDSLYLTGPTEDPLDRKSGLRATIDLRDPPDVKNWYLWEQIVDGTTVASDSNARSPAVAGDEGLDGRAIRHFQPFDEIVIKPASDVLVRQIALSEAVYHFYRALGEQTENDGSPFAVPLASVRGNIRNVTDPSRIALGYFIAAEVSEARMVAPPN